MAKPKAALAKPKAAPKPKATATKSAKASTSKAKAKPSTQESGSDDDDAAGSAMDEDADELFDGMSSGAPTPGAKGLGDKLAEVGGQAGKGKSASEMYQKVSAVSSLAHACLELV